MLVLSMPIYYIDFVWQKKKNKEQKLICSDLGQNCTFSAKRKSILCMYIFFSPAEFVKNALKHLRTPKDTSPAVKISGPVPPMQQALCVCVLKADPVAAIPSPYPATTPPPHPTHKATLCEVRLCCRYQKGCKCSCGHSARPSNCCHVTGTMCSPLL